VGTTCEKASETGPTLVGEIHDGPIIGNDICFQENGPCLDDFGPFKTEEIVCENVRGVNVDFGVGVDLNGVGGADINEEGCVDLNGVGDADINEEGYVDLNDASFVDINAEPSVGKDGVGGPSIDAEPTGVEETGSGGVEAEGEPTVVEEIGAGGVEVGAEPTVVEETSAGGVEVGAEPTGVEKTGVEGNLDEGGESDGSALDIWFLVEEDDACWLAGNFDNEIGELDVEELKGEAFNDDPMREHFESVDGEVNVTVGDGNASANGDNGGVTSVNGNVVDGGANGVNGGVASVNAQPTTGAGVEFGTYIF